MLNNNIGKYYSIDSLIHRINPIIKIISMILFLFTVFISNDLLIQLVLLIFLIFIIYLTNIEYNQYLYAIRKMKYLILMYIIINLICKETILNTTVVVVKFISIILNSFILTYTTKSTDITYSLEKIFYPLRKIFPIKAFALIISLSLQFIPIIIDQTNKIIKSLASRGKDYKTAKISQKWGILSAIMIPLFILSLKRADEVSDAYTVRHYSLIEESIPYTEYQINIYDIIYLITHITILILIIIKGVI